MVPIHKNSSFHQDVPSSEPPTLRSARLIEVDPFTTWTEPSPPPHEPCLEDDYGMPILEHSDILPVIRPRFAPVSEEIELLEDDLEILFEEVEDLEGPDTERMLFHSFDTEPPPTLRCPGIYK